MKRIVQLLFFMTVVTGLTAIEPDLTNDQEAPSNPRPKGFNKRVQMGLWESLFYFVDHKSLEKDMVLSLEGEELIAVPISSPIDKGKVTLRVRYQGTNNFPCIPNIELFKDHQTIAVEGGDDNIYKQIIYLPANLVDQQVVKLSVEKSLIGAFVGLVVGIGLYKNLNTV